MKLLDYLQKELNKKNYELSVITINNILLPSSLQKIINYLRVGYLSLYKGLDEIFGIDFCKKQFPNTFEDCESLIKDFLRYLKINGDKEISIIEIKGKGGDVIKEIVERCEL